MKKHAYLIMAHNNLQILYKTLELLDDYRSDIYIHIDKKDKNVDFDKIKKCVCKSDIYFVDRIKVNWGGYSQINCELILLKEAIKIKYQYYHLLSGIDIPLMTQDEINEFFDKNKGKQFFEITDLKNADHDFSNRVKYYHLLIDKINRANNNIYYLLLKCLNKIIIKIQTLLKVDRIKKSKLTYKKGANWFSITHELAAYIVSKESWIQDNFKYTFCADEVFLQTIAWNSKFKEDICNDTLRCIDWNRGQPYTFRIEDYNLLINSNKIWARKFSYDVDSDIIEKLIHYVSEK